MNSKPFETLPKNGGVRQNTSDGTKIDKHLPPSRRRIGGIYGFAVLLSLVLFYFHVVVIFDVIAEMLRFKAWMLEHLGPKHTGKILLLGSFFALMLAHVAEAAVWGLFLRWTRLLPSITEGVYFTASIDHNAGLRRHPAEVSLETSRHADRDNRGADVWLFDGVLVRGSTGCLAALLGRLKQR